MNDTDEIGSLVGQRLAQFASNVIVAYRDEPRVVENEGPIAHSGKPIQYGMA
jgi:hypothetical protein